MDEFKQQFTYGPNEYFLRQVIGEYAIYDLISNNGKSNGLVLLKNPINLDSNNHGKTWWFEANLNNITKKLKELTEGPKDDGFNLNWSNLGTEYNYDSHAEAILSKIPLYYDNSKIWWAWKDNCWEIIDDIDIMGLIKSQFKAIGLGDSKTRTSLLNSLKDASRLNKPKPAKDTWIQFDDYIYDISQEKWEDVLNNSFEATPEYFVTNPIPHRLVNILDNNGKERYFVDVIDSLFEDWVGDKKELLYEILSYSLIPDYPMNRIFCLTGSGCNGKSTFLNILQIFIGNRNLCTSELDRLANPSSRFESVKLYKKLVCQLGETDWGKLNNTSMLKKLSGKDLIPAEIKNKNPFDFINYAKIVIATNTLPVTGDKTDGFYRRWLILGFNKQFGEKRDVISEIPNDEWSSLTALCLKKLHSLLKKRSFSYEGTIEDRKKAYEEHSNPIMSFLNSKYDKDVNSFINTSDVYNEFEKYVTQKGLRQQSYKEFIASLSFNGIETERKNAYIFSNDVYLHAEELPFGVRSFDCKRQKKNFIVGYKVIESDESDESRVSNRFLNKETKLNPLTQVTQVTQEETEEIDLR